MLSTIGRAAVRRLVSKPIATSSVVSRLSLRAGVSQNSLGWLVSSFQKSCAVRSFASEADGAKAPKTTTRKRAATKASATPKKAAAKPKKTKVVKKKVVKKSTSATGEKKKKAATRRKRELTPEETAKLQIKELKNTSLYFAEPKNAGAVTPWPLFLQENLSGSKPRSMEANNERFKELAVDFKSLSSSELARLQSVCEENRLKNAATFKAWVESHTPEQIRDANNARNMLKRKFNYPKAPKTKHLINDDRKPASPVPSYGYFTKARWASGDFNNMNVKEAATSIAAEWKNMSESEKKPYMDLGQADVHRFLKATDRATS